MRNAKKMKRYISAIARRLNMPKEVKERVMNDFFSSIEGRREAGQTDEEIFRELSTPQKVAAELNEQMKDYTYIKSPWRWACFAIIIGCVISIVFGGTIGFLAYLLNGAVTESIGIIGGADGPTAVFIATSSDFLWYRAGITLVVLIMGILGFWRLSRCPRK